MTCSALGRAPRTAAALCALLAGAFAAGCGPGQVNVSGRVLYDGAPLPGGWVTFRPADSGQNAITARIDEQGRYQAVLPAGDVQACVDNRDLAPREPSPPVALPPDIKNAIEKAGGKVPAAPAAAPPKEPAAPGKYVEIPTRYYEAETSGLQFTVSAATKEHDIKLTK